MKPKISLFLHNYDVMFTWYSAKNIVKAFHLAALKSKNWRLYNKTSFGTFYSRPVECTNICSLVNSDVLFSSIWNLIFTPLNLATLINLRKSQNKEHTKIKGFTVFLRIKLTCFHTSLALSDTVLQDLPASSC